MFWPWSGNEPGSVTHEASDSLRDQKSRPEVLAQSLPLGPLDVHVSLQMLQPINHIIHDRMVFVFLQSDENSKTAAVVTAVSSMKTADHFNKVLFTSFVKKVSSFI